MLSLSPSVPSTDILFYDGHCGLCHGAVKFVLRRDRAGEFRFAPLQGLTFAQKIAPEQRASLPDSVALLTADGRLLVRSDAFIHIFRQLGGAWSAFATISAVVPRPVRDVVYGVIARIRYSIFGRRGDLCPVVPESLRKRFLN
ncbi:MAG TPA: DCC1-like thiol-disulfide oxidoreductase family protein [Candidatus Aquilonibacter sp.]|nr:DCC1-like thiol-disulfide oxidoreductase family protein [Candidatus Aquilonibacter sp.]